MDAIKRGLRALDELEVGGISTTAGFHKKVVSHPAFQSGKFDTSLVEKMQADEDKARANDKVPAAR
jgi:acetyl-CoA carboxylase biotin carboxylase subunit